MKFYTKYEIFFCPIFFLPVTSLRVGSALPSVAGTRTPEATSSPGSESRLPAVLATRRYHKNIKISMFSYAY
jgi:hypothetical protein